MNKKLIIDGMPNTYGDTLDEQWDHLCIEVQKSINGNSRVFGAAFQKLAANNWGENEYPYNSYDRIEFKDLYTSVHKQQTYREYINVGILCQSLFDGKTHFLEFNKNRIKKGLQKYDLLCNYVKQMSNKYNNIINDIRNELNIMKLNNMVFQKDDKVHVLYKQKWHPCTIIDVNLNNFTYEIEIYLHSSKSEKSTTIVTKILKSVKPNQMKYSDEQLEQFWDYIKKSMYNTKHEFSWFDGSWEYIQMSDKNKYILYKEIYKCLKKLNWKQTKHYIYRHDYTDGLIGIFDGNIKGIKNHNCRIIKKALFSLYGDKLYHDLSHKFQFL